MTFPKFNVEGLAVSDACTPVPVASITAGEFVASLITETVPFTDPAAVGANTIDSTVVCPALSIIGVAIPLALSPAPITPTLEIVTLPAPEFVSVTLLVLLFPKLIFPNATLVELTTSVLPVELAITSDTGIEYGELFTVSPAEFGAVMVVIMCPLYVPAARPVVLTHALNVTAEFPTVGVTVSHAASVLIATGKGADGVVSF